MLKIHLYIFLLLPLLFIGCTKSDFNLDFDLSDDVTDTYNVTYYATDKQGGATVQAVASVRDGKCLLQGVSRKPTLVYISARRAVVPLVALVSPGENLKITGIGKDPLAWKVEGNQINENVSAWINENKNFLIDNEADSVNLAVKRYVDDHRDNPASTILMLCYYHRYSNEREYAELMHSLEGEAHSPQWLEIIGRSDQLYHYYTFPAALQSMVLRSMNDRDTLFINHRNPVFMFFWQTGDNNDKKNFLDSIKALNKELPDSSLLLADICLDVDSTAWRNAIKRDSLKNVKRFWVPLGLNDYEMQKFKVDAIPYFIVFDKEGHQSYRGTEISKAMENYRILYNSKDSIAADSIP